jgi:hypothetical protein
VIVQFFCFVQGKEKYYDGTFVVANPSFHALIEARSLWNSSIDCLISVGSGLNPSVGSNLEGDRFLQWNDKIVDVVNLIDTSTSETSLECQRNDIYFVRLNPELSMGVPLDRFSQKDIQTILNTVDDYLKTNDTQLKKICRHLVASLLYVSKVNELPGQTDNWEIIVCSRTKDFSLHESLATECQLVIHCVEGEVESTIAYTKNDTSIPSSEKGTQYATIKIRLQSQSQTKIRISLMFDHNEECVISGGREIPLKMDKDDVLRSHSESATHPTSSSRLDESEVTGNASVTAQDDINVMEPKQSQQSPLTKIPPSKTQGKRWSNARPKSQTLPKQQIFILSSKVNVLFSSHHPVFFQLY